MLLRIYRHGMNRKFSLLARNCGIFKLPSVVEFNHANPMEHVRCASTTPINTIIKFVPQQEAWIVERMGKFHQVLKPGLNILMPIIDKIKYVQSLKEITIEIPGQIAITSDNVTLNIDGVLYLRIIDPYLASYGIEDPEFAVTQLAQTTMRSELGKMALEKVFAEREDLNTSIVDSINEASKVWGITCLRYEIRDIKLPERIQEAMQMQVEAERKKRAAILESEGDRQAEINRAEGKRLAQILASEGAKQEDINKANGAAAALMTVTEARAKSLEMMAGVLTLNDAKHAAALNIAEQYIKAYNNLARTNNTLILPSNIADVSSVVTQAMTIYKQIMTNFDNIEAKQNQNNSLSLNEPNESYEYFSDKEEAEKHKKSRKRKP